MYIIKPLTIDPATEVTNLSVPMDDVYPAWDALLLYQQGDIVVTGTGETQKIWEARHAVVTPIDQSSSLPNLYNQGVDPLQTNVVGRNNDGSLVANATEYNHFGEGWWRDATEDKYLANRYRMFDPNPAFYTESDVNIVFTIKPTGIWSGVALFNIVADSITITLNNGPEAYTATRNLRFDPILSQEFQNEPQVAFVDLPLIDSNINVSTTLTIELSVSSPRYQRIGYVCIGEAVEVGKASYGVTTELMDFSRFERDVFGNVFAIKRGYSDKITYPYVVKAADIAQVRQILIARRATLTAYIGHPDVPLTITYGYFIDLDIPIDNWGQSDASIVVESVLYDTPGSTEDLPNVVEFIDPTLECIEESKGRVIEVCLTNGVVTEQVTASIVGVITDPSDSVEWEILWVIGNSEVSGVNGNIITGCDQYLPIFTWPESVPAEHLPATALIKATITKADTSVVVLEPATLIVRECAPPCGQTDGLKAGWVSSSSLAIVENRDAFCRGDFVRLRASYVNEEIELSGESGFQQTFFVDERVGSTNCQPADCVTYVRLLGGFGDVTADIYRHLPGLGAEKLETLSIDGNGSGAAEFAVIPGSSKTFVFVVVRASSAFSTTLSASRT